MLEYKAVKTVSGTCGYVTLGSGYPLIMIVGYSGTLFHWHGSFVEELAKYYTVYLVDNRNIGLSQSTNEESIPGFAKDIADFIVALNLKKPYILGWSMGGLAVQELMKSYANMVSVAVLMATVPDMADVSPNFLDFITKAGHISAQDFRHGIYYFFFSHKEHSKSKSQLTKSALNFSNYHYRFESKARQLQDKAIAAWSGMSKEALAKIKIPTLLLWAKNDLVVPKKSALFLSDYLQFTKLIIYTSGGHFLLQDNYSQIANDIINFIENYPRIKQP